MKTLKYGEWEFSVDIEKTREYYAQLKVSETQANRNFAKYCENMPAEEREFFESFGVSIEKCDVDVRYYQRSKNMYSIGNFCFCGRCEVAPREFDLLEEEFSEKEIGDIIQIEATSPIYFKIGNFEFQFQKENGYLADLEEDIPKGFICVNFCCSNMKWLLKGKPKDNGNDIMVVPELPGAFEPHIRLVRYLKGKYNHIKYIREVKKEYAQTFTELGIEYRKMGKFEYEKYRREWVLRFAPKGSDFEEISKHCLKNEKYGVYLWHLFSYDYRNCDEIDEARVRFDSARKCKLVLIDDWNAKGYVLRNTKKLTSAVVEKFTDVTITPANFAWTYSKTHEEDMCGPYFYENNNL